jgi:hypothetical protein
MRRQERLMIAAKARHFGSVGRNPPDPLLIPARQTMIQFDWNMVWSVRLSMIFSKNRFPFFGIML